MKTLLFTLTFFVVQLTPSFGQTSSNGKQQVKASKDTIYIPFDLDDCIQQLDKMFADSNKTKIKAMTEDEFSSRMHFDFGMWIRNNWGLWKGSRLSKFFNIKGIHHPDDMSGIIFCSYYRHLTGRDIKLEEQINYYKDYWEKAKVKAEERKQTEFAGYHIGDTVLFNYRNRFVSKLQEKMYDNDICTAKGVITEKNENEFFVKVRLLDACDKKGIISSDNEGTLVYNELTKKMEKPKRRIVTYMKVGGEKWFNYDDWETKY